jgi:hypothetical protein
LEEKEMLRVGAFFFFFFFFVFPDERDNFFKSGEL